MSDLVDPVPQWEYEREKKYETNPDEKWYVEVYNQSKSDYNPNDWEEAEAFGTDWEKAQDFYNRILPTRRPVRLVVVKDDKVQILKEYWPS